MFSSNVWGADRRRCMTQPRCLRVLTVGFASPILICRRPGVGSQVDTSPPKNVNWRLLPAGNERLLGAFYAGASHRRPPDLAHGNGGPGLERAGAVSHSEASMKKAVFGDGKLLLLEVLFAIQLGGHSSMQVSSRKSQNLRGPGHLAAQRNIWPAASLGFKRSLSCCWIEHGQSGRLCDFGLYHRLRSLDHRCRPKLECAGLLVLRRFNTHSGRALERLRPHLKIIRRLVELGLKAKGSKP